MAWSLCESEIPKDKWTKLRWSSHKHGVPMTPELYEDEIEDPDNATRRTPSPETYDYSMPIEKIIEITSAPPEAQWQNSGTKHGHDKHQQPYKKYRTGAENSSYSQPSSSWRTQDDSSHRSDTFAEADPWAKGWEDRKHKSYSSWDDASSTSYSSSGWHDSAPAPSYSSSHSSDDWHDWEDSDSSYSN